MKLVMILASLLVGFSAMADRAAFVQGNADGVTIVAAWEGNAAVKKCDDTVKDLGLMRLGRDNVYKQNFCSGDAADAIEYDANCIAAAVTRAGEVEAIFWSRKSTNSEFCFTGRGGCEDFADDANGPLVAPWDELSCVAVTDASGGLKNWNSSPSTPNTDPKSNF